MDAVIDLPAWFLGALAATLLGLAALVARNMFTTVRRAAQVVGTNETLQLSNDALRECIADLERKVASLAAENKALTIRVLDLERLYRDELLKTQVKHRRIAAANEDPS
jgi:cell division protein FtsB